MKCTNKCIPLFITVSLAVSALTGCGQRIEGSVSFLPYDTYATVLPQENSTASVRAESFSANLCVCAPEDTSTENTDVWTCQAASVINADTLSAPFAYHIFDRVYPASTTKIMTLLCALENGNPDDLVTVSDAAAGQPKDSSICGLLPGDVMTLRDLCYGMFLKSGNDAAHAIAEHVGGSIEGFAELMNRKALSLGATNSHFVNPHGLHDEEHYTTAYDMYLILNNAIQNPDFLEIFSASSYTVNYKNAAGEENSVTWNTTNHYKTGEETPPEGYTVLGGKTGTTYDAGYCLVLLVENPKGQKEVISIFKADARINLYLVMNQLMQFYGDL